MFSEMRETRTNFGAKMKNDYSPGQQHQAKGGLQPEDDEDEDDEQVGEDDEDEDENEEGIEVDEEEEINDQNF